MPKLVHMVVKSCQKCPHHYFEEDQDPMGCNGWDRCAKQRGKYLKNTKVIDSGCPLPDATE